MRILRWMCRVTKLHRIKKKAIHNSRKTKVGEIPNKLQESRLYRYFTRREKVIVSKRVMVQGKEREIQADMDGNHHQQIEIEGIVGR